jgi:hypothetical protein
MKRSTRFTVSFLAAAITFGSLMVFANPMNGFRHRDTSHAGYMHHHDCNRGEDSRQQEKVQRHHKDPVAVDSSGSAQ